MSTEYVPPTPNDSDKAPSNNDHDRPRYPNYALRRFGAGALIGLSGLGAVKLYELARDTLITTAATEIGCVDVNVRPGDNNLDPIERAIATLEAKHDELSVLMTSDVNREADGLGIIHPGEDIEVCGVDDIIFGDTITADRSD